MRRLTALVALCACASAPRRVLEPRLDGCRATVWGVVRGPTGRPIAGAEVRTATPVAVVRTDARGEYALCAAASTGELSVVAAGFAATRDEYRLVRHTRVDFRLEEEIPVSGRVLGAAGRVTIVAESRHWQFPDVTTVAQDDGRFRLSGLGPYGFYVVRARSPGTAASAVVEARPFEPRSELEMALTPTATVRGRVDVGGVEVTLADARGPVAHALAAGDGTFEMAEVPRGALEITVAGRDVVPPGVVEAGSPREAAVKTTPRATLTGRVTRRGAPAARAEVAVEQVCEGDCVERRVLTDDDGRFMLNDLPAGEFWLTAADRLQGAWADPERRVQAGTEVSIELDREGSIAGVLVDAAGAPIAGATLSFARVDEIAARARRYEQAILVFSRDLRDVPGIDTTDASGRFEARGLAADGEYTVEVIRASHPHSEVLPPLPGRAFPRVTLTAKRPRAEGVRVAAVRADRRIRGIVLFQGRPARGMTIDASTLVTYRDQHEEFVRTATDADGRFELSGLHAGEYEVTPNVIWAESTQVMVAAGREDVVLELRARKRSESPKPTGTATVTVFVHDQDGKPFAGAHCHNYLDWGHREEALSDLSGKLTLPSPSGVRLEIGCEPFESHASTEITLSPGEVRQVDLLLPRPVPKLP